MITKTVSETREGLADLLGRVQHGGEEVTIMKHGKPVAAIISIEALAFLERMEDEALGQMAAESYAEYLADPSKARSAEEVFADLLADDRLE